MQLARDRPLMEWLVMWCIRSLPICIYNTHESSSAVQHFKQSNRIMPDYYPGLSQLLLLLGGGTVKCTIYDGI